jgi:hypothetical protein
VRGQKTVTHTRPTITYADPDESIIFEDFTGATATFSISTEPELTLAPRTAKFSEPMSVNTSDGFRMHHPLTFESRMAQSHKEQSTSTVAMWVTTSSGVVPPVNSMTSSSALALDERDHVEAKHHRDKDDDDNKHHSSTSISISTVPTPLDTLSIAPPLVGRPENVTHHHKDKTLSSQKHVDTSATSTVMGTFSTASPKGDFSLMPRQATEVLSGALPSRDLVPGPGPRVSQTSSLQTFSSQPSLPNFVQPSRTPIALPLPISSSSLPGGTATPPDGMIIPSRTPISIPRPPVTPLPPVSSESPVQSQLVDLLPGPVETETEPTEMTNLAKRVDSKVDKGDEDSHERAHSSTKDEDQRPISSSTHHHTHIPTASTSDANLSPQVGSDSYPFGTKNSPFDNFYPYGTKGSPPPHPPSFNMEEVQEEDVNNNDKGKRQVIPTGRIPVPTSALAQTTATTYQPDGTATTASASFAATSSATTCPCCLECLGRNGLEPLVTCMEKCTYACQQAATATMAPVATAARTPAVAIKGQPESDEKE